MHNGNTGRRGTRSRKKYMKKKMHANLINLVKNFNLDIQQAHQTPSRINTKRSTRRVIIIKMLKAEDKGKMLKAAKEK